MILPSSFCPLHAAEEILDQFRELFIKAMEAEKVIEELLHKDIISGDQVTSEPSQELKTPHCKTRSSIDV